MEPIKPKDAHQALMRARNADDRMTVSEAYDAVQPFLKSGGEWHSMVGAIALLAAVCFVSWLAFT